MNIHENAARNDVAISIVEETLTDGSTVFNVKLTGVTLPACSQEDATALADGIAALINEHTTFSAGVSYW